MIKPLLRTIPTLSGNVKLACTLLDYNKIDKDTFEANIRGAHIYPLSSQLFQKNIEANLLNSSWEFDIKKFYSLYSDIFFESCFNYNKTEIPILDKTLDIYPRNTDFEYGVKRISYSKSGNQFACFAPIYLDNVDDIPEYFLLKIKLVSKKHSTIKYIKVNIASNKTKNITASNNNYIYHYIYKYINKIDDNVVFINNGDKTVNYYGIDLINGGFTKYTDTTISAILDTCIPMQMFDFSISEGFKRNRMCMRQSLPLCFYFNISDILNSTEQERYKFAELYFSGAYHIIKNGIDVELPWYDFDWDYDNYSQSILDVNSNNGMLRKTNGYLKNIMDVGFPAFNDRYLTNFQFANRFTPIFNRWKLKYSSDEHPYITNMSWAFSGNQDNNYKYREFPVQYTNQPGYAIVNDSLEYNLILPIGDTKIHYDNINSKSTVKYNSILENYCLNWFDVLETDSLDKGSLINTVNWVDVNDGYTYFNGVLYNLNNIYNKVELTNDNDKINKFAIIVNPITDNIYNATNNELIFTKYSFSKTGELNCCLNNVFDEDISDLYNLTGENNYAIDETGIFSEISETDSDKIDFTNVYVNLLNVNKSYIELNKLYNINEPEFEKIKNLYVPEDEYKNLEKDLTDDETKFKNAVDKLKEILRHKTDKFTTAFTSIDEFYEPILDVLATAFCSYNLEIHEAFDAIPDIFKTVFGKELFCEVPLYRSNSYIYGLTNYLNNKNSDLLIFDNLYISSKNNITPTKISENTNIIRELGNTTYGQMLYFKSNFINTMMFDDEAKKPISTNIFDMYKLWKSSKGEYFNLVNLEIENTYEYNLKTALTRFYTNILEECKTTLNGDIANTYEFLPKTEYNGKLVAQNTCRRYQTKIANIDSEVSSELFDADDNVLFVHEYNFANVCNAVRVDINKLPSTKKYVKVLDKNYLDKMFILSSVNTHFYKQSKVILPDFTIKFKYDIINYETLNKIEFDNETKLFYDADNKNDKFVIVEYATVYKISKSLFEKTFNKTEFFIDLLVFRPITNIEYDEKYSSKCQVFIYNKSGEFIPVSYKTSDIPSNVSLDALNYIDYYNLISQYNDDDLYNTDFYEFYSDGSDSGGSSPVYPEPDPTPDVPNVNITFFETDEFLYPCFNDFNYQNKENTLLNKNIILDNINDISVNSSENGIDIYKRYNTCDFYAFISIDKDTYDSLGDSKPILYKKLHTKKFVELNTEVNENPIYANKPKINVFTNNGITYGIYILNVDINNTYDFFNIRGVVDTDENSLNSNNIDELSMLKIFNYVNNVNIIENPNYLKHIFKQLCPFMNIDLLTEIHDLNIIVNPHTFNLVNTYYTSKDNVNNNSKELKLMYDKQTIITVKKQILQRYTHNIIPYLKETLVIPALPKLKYKMIKTRLLDTGMYYSIGDVVFDINKNNNINIPYSLNIYGESDDLSIKSYNNVIGSFMPHEYKYYNNSKLRNLPTKLTFIGKTLYTYSQIVEMESEENTIRIFKNLISKYIDNVEDNELILFLYKKYKKSYNATTKGTNITLTDKVYKLEYKFTLL